MSNMYDQGLDKNDANFVALSPVSFVERSAEVFGDLESPWFTAGVDTPGVRHA